MNYSELSASERTLFTSVDFDEEGQLLATLFSALHNVEPFIPMRIYKRCTRPSEISVEQ